MTKKNQKTEKKESAVDTADREEHKTPVSENKPEQEEEQQKNKEKEAEDKYLRLYAEFDNFRKRTQLEKEELAKYAAAETVRTLFPLMDSFERAQSSFEKHTDDTEELKKGLALIHKQFEDILKKLGVVKIETKDVFFDANLHEAVMQQEAAGVEPQTIIEEVQAGFLINGKVLRYAKVIVAK